MLLMFHTTFQYFDSHFLLCSQTEQCGDRTCIGLAWDMTSTSCVPVSSTIVHQETHQPAGGSPDVLTTSISTKSAQRAYLQSLDRSSRAWVLSSGKTQATSEAFGLQEESGSNIWYNPIPEEEDAGGPHREDEIWRRRDETGDGVATKRTGPGDTRAELGGVWVGSGESFSSECPLEGGNPSVSHHIDDITTENTGKKTFTSLSQVSTLWVFSFKICFSFVFLSHRLPCLRLKPNLTKESGCVWQRD